MMERSHPTSRAVLLVLVVSVIILTLEVVSSAYVMDCPEDMENSDCPTAICCLNEKTNITYCCSIPQRQSHIDFLKTASRGSGSRGRSRGRNHGQYGPSFAGTDRSGYNTQSIQVLWIILGSAGGLVVIALIVCCCTPGCSIHDRLCSNEITRAGYERTSVEMLEKSRNSNLYNSPTKFGKTPPPPYSNAVKNVTYNLPPLTDDEEEGVESFVSQNNDGPVQTHTSSHTYVRMNNV